MNLSFPGWTLGLSAVGAWPEDNHLEGLWGQHQVTKV